MVDQRLDHLRALLRHGVARGLRILREAVGELRGIGREAVEHRLLLRGETIRNPPDAFAERARLVDRACRDAFADRLRFARQAAFEFGGQRGDALALAVQRRLQVSQALRQNRIGRRPAQQQRQQQHDHDTDTAQHSEAFGRHPSSPDSPRQVSHSACCGASAAVSGRAHAQGLSAGSAASR